MQMNPLLDRVDQLSEQAAMIFSNPCMSRCKCYVYDRHNNPSAFVIQLPVGIKLRNCVKAMKHYVWDAIHGTNGCFHSYQISLVCIEDNDLLAVESQFNALPVPPAEQVRKLHGR